MNKQILALYQPKHIHSGEIAQLCVNRFLLYWRLYPGYIVRVRKSKRILEVILCTNDGKKSSDKINLDVLSNYFSQLNKDKNVYDVSEVDRASDHTVFENAYLNEPFSEDEVMAVLSQLKCGSCGKAAGPDLLINEFFKYSRTTRSTCMFFVN